MRRCTTSPASTSRVCRIVRSQVNVAAQPARPRARPRSWTCARRTASARAAGVQSAATAAWPPATSVVAGSGPSTTGLPSSIPSTTGSPNPSKSDGKTTRSASESTCWNSSSGRNGASSTRSPSPRAATRAAMASRRADPTPRSLSGGAPPGSAASSAQASKSRSGFLLVWCAKPTDGPERVGAGQASTWSPPRCTARPGTFLRRRVQPVQVVEAALRDRDERVCHGVGAAVRHVAQQSPAAAELLGPQLVAQVEDHDAQRRGHPAHGRGGRGREHRVDAELAGQPGQRPRLGQRPAEHVRAAHRQLVPHTVARGQGRAHPERDVHLVVGEDVAPLAEQVVDVGADAAVLRTHGIDQELHLALGCLLDEDHEGGSQPVGCEPVDARSDPPDRGRAAEVRRLAGVSVDVHGVRCEQPASGPCGCSSRSGPGRRPRPCGRAGAGRAPARAACSARHARRGRSSPTCWACGRPASRRA